MAASYSIRAVAEKTGLSPHTIRVWERRYAVLSPERTESNRRMYGEPDVERLRMIVRAMHVGHSIGMIASLPNEELAKLAVAPATPFQPGIPSEDFLAQCLNAMTEYDAESFQSAIRRAFAVLGVERLLSDVVLPLLKEVADGWRGGTVCIAQEHFVSAFLRTELEQIRLSFVPRPDAPRILITTPSGQMHELGALMAAITAARHGWRVTYLGPNLPAGEVAAAAKQVGARVVGLSVVYPDADLRTTGELKRLHELLGPGYTILVGGGAAGTYRAVLEEMSATPVPDLPALAAELSRLASLPRPLNVEDIGRAY